MHHSTLTHAVGPTTQSAESVQHTDWTVTNSTEALQLHSGPYHRHVESLTPAQRIRIALDLYEVGEGMMRARLKREKPRADDAEIQFLIERWLRTRPGAEHGDYPGEPSGRWLGGS